MVFDRTCFFLLLHLNYLILADEFAVLLNSKTILPPHLCRKGCKHYDSVGDQESAEFREFCWMSKETRIKRDSVCENFEPSVATPEPIEDDSQKVQGGNGQENYVDAPFKGFGDSAF